jgi:hypothetical protein
VRGEHAETEGPTCRAAVTALTTQYRVMGVCSGTTLPSTSPALPAMVVPEALDFPGASTWRRSEFEAA